MTTPLICIDCRFAELQITPKEAWICGHPTSLYHPRQSLVTGAVFKPYQLKCADARFSFLGASCGEEGRHWEPRE
jgi:hypothetical protein